jgi:hypothetical protein
MKIRTVIIAGAFAIGASAAGAATATEVPFACEQDKCFRMTQCVDNTGGTSGCDMVGSTCHTYDCRMQ